jgi:hypothetical protein
MLASRLSDLESRMCDKRAMARIHGPTMLRHRGACPRDGRCPCRSCCDKSALKLCHKGRVVRPPSPSSPFQYATLDVYILSATLIDTGTATTMRHVRVAHASACVNRPDRPSDRAAQRIYDGANTTPGFRDAADHDGGSPSCLHEGHRALESQTGGQTTAPER